MSIVPPGSPQKQDAGDGDENGDEDQDGNGDEDEHGSMHCAAEGEVTTPARSSA